MLRIPGAFLIFISFILQVASQQEYRQKNSAEIYQQLKKLQVLGNVLYLAAHPDDENTRVISYFANEKLCNTSYLSLTRGDGGQNLIGAEQGELLGVIRTQELLQARRIDGGSQYFSRARDFGFSKTPEETFKIWEKEKVLSDVVWVIRRTRPDIIITRFSPDAGKTHGHHTASAMLAVEAAEAAGDPNIFPEQLKTVSVWKPKRFVWNTGKFFYKSEEELKKANPFSMDVGGYNFLYGESYGEKSAKSRTMHKSQGFGTTAGRGEAPEYFQHLSGTKASKDLLEDVNTSWSRLTGTKDIEKITDKIINNYKFENPDASVASLVDLYKKISLVNDSWWKMKKLDEVKSIIQQCLGIHVEAIFPEARITQGEKVNVTCNLINRSAIPVEFVSFKIEPDGLDTNFSYKASNKVLTFHSTFRVPEKTELTHPFWLKENGTPGMFVISEPSMVAEPESKSPFFVKWKILVNGITLEYATPIVNKVTDPVEGDVFNSIQVVPPVSVNITHSLYIFSDESPKVIPCIVKANKDHVKGTLKIKAPQGWKLRSDSVFFELERKGQERKIEIELQPGINAESGQLTASCKVNDKEFTTGIISIEYPHIGTQLLQPNSTAKILKTKLEKRGNNIGYLLGAGDNVPSSLEQLGYQVTMLQDNDVTFEKIKFFDAIVVGVRAYNTNERIRIYQQDLLKYAENGGTLIVQYNTVNGLKIDNPAPYQLHLSSERTTVEDAPVKILKPDHPVMNFPNKVTSEDFDGWVQERGLYFPDQWGKEFEPLLATHDPGQSSNEGGLLVANYGKGYYIYTSYSWFRQLPAGVPGALKLFVNLLSIGKK